MATHDDDRGDGKPSPAERAWMSRRLRQIAEALGVPVASFFEPVEPQARTKVLPERDGKPASKKQRGAP